MIVIHTQECSHRPSVSTMRGKELMRCQRSGEIHPEYDVSDLAHQTMQKSIPYQQNNPTSGENILNK